MTIEMESENEDIGLGEVEVFLAEQKLGDSEDMNFDYLSYLMGLFFQILGFSFIILVITAFTKPQQI